ncbi:histidine phosphatase family protein [Lysobacter panacisoli]|uniref:Histidine phosphatase family protein n=1 Tax=Lysobacter panacisoli TaxID=1255263 RepID=A0ABP9LCB1_9GAMM|nr:histidine phosphatase family protein [Lysobacter panacisoli]
MSHGSTTRIDLLRHGDTGEYGYRGQLDDPLSMLGWSQLRGSVIDGAWDVVVSSPLQRCAAFGEELARLRGLPMQLDRRLAEYHFGQWQGVSMETLANGQGDALARFWADPVAYPPPGAESFASFRARLVAALDDVVARHAGLRVLVVAHGGAIRLLRCIAEGRSFGEMANLEVVHASLHPLAWRVAQDLRA